MLTTVPAKTAPGLHRPVSEIMHHGYIALPATATLADVASAMRDNKVHAVLITDAGGTPSGWVTSRGMLHNHARDWSVASSAADAITEPAATIAATASLADAVTLFIATAASHLLVAATTAAAPIGVIADSDLVAHIAR